MYVIVLAILFSRPIPVGGDQMTAASERMPATSMWCLITFHLASSPGQIFSLTKRTNGNGSTKKGPGIYCKGDL